MTDKEILQKALDKAIENGWTRFTIGGKDKIRAAYVFCHEGEPLKIALHWTYNNDGINYTTQESVESIILLHSFAEAFWGKNGIAVEISTLPPGLSPIEFIEKWKDENFRLKYPYVKVNELEGWKHHLQQMVLEENRIKYLEQFL